LAGGALGAGLAYSGRWRAAAERGGARRRHAAAFAAGLVVLLGAMAGPLDVLGEERLLSAHMAQHLLLMSLVPALWFGAFPPALAPRAIRDRGPRDWPPWTAGACLAAGVGTIWILHVPGVLDPALSRPALHDLQHLGLVAAGVLLAWPLTASGPLRGMAAVAYVVGAEIGIGILGIWLAWYPEVVYATYAEAPRTWGLSAETDQSLAGAILLVVEEPFLAVEFAIVFLRALGD
jgi:cytochrome c oxidase assembly factor CtaG